jgi:hypothetical protein
MYLYYRFILYIRNVSPKNKTIKKSAKCHGLDGGKPGRISGVIYEYVYMGFSLELKIWDYDRRVHSMAVFRRVSILCCP